MRVASFLGSRVWAEKNSPVRTVCACSVPYNLLRYTKPHEVCRLLPYERCLPLTTFCEDDDEGVTKIFAWRNCVRPFHKTLQHMTDTIFPIEVHWSPRTKQCKPLPLNRYCFWLQNRPQWVDTKWEPNFDSYSKKHSVLIVHWSASARLQTPRYIQVCDTMVCALYHMCT